jgi:ATP-dependent DNA helicase RecG
MTNHPFPPLAVLLSGETLEIEYKRDDAKSLTAPLSDDAIALSLMAIGNADGGYLLVGVQNNGAVSGLHSRRTDDVSKTRDTVLRKFLSAPHIGTHRYVQEGVRIFAFHIAPATKEPYQLRDGSLKIRKMQGNKQGPENVPFPLSELPQWQAQRGVHYDFSSAFIPDLLWRDRDRYLNPLAVSLLEKRIADQRTSPELRRYGSFEQQVEALELVGTLNGRKTLTNAALLLFGKNEIIRERIPAHQAQFQVFAADGSLPYNLFSGREGLEHLSLLILVTRLEELFRGIIPRREMMDGPFRLDIPAYGDDALREGYMNAFIHRDYTISEPVIIQMTTEQLIMTSPGGFYRDVTPENILFHEPCSRNQRLALACAALGLVFWDQIRFCRPMPSYAESSDQAVRLRLMGGDGSLEAIRWMLEHFSGEEDLRVKVVHGGLIHVLISEGETARETLINALPGLDNILGRQAITELIDAGLVRRIGHGRGQRLVLSPEFQRDLGKPEAFVYQVGLDIEGQRQMILSYVEAHGSISRQEAAKLIGRPADDSVYKLLRRMVMDQLLQRQGITAAARYHKR